MNPFKLIIFDFDGTLGDSFPWFLKTLNEAAGRFGFNQVPPDKVIQLRQLTAFDIMKMIGVSKWKVPFLAWHFRRRMAKQINQISLFDNALITLEKLHKAGIIIAIVSSNTESNVRTVLGSAGVKLIHSFDCGASISGKKRLIKRAMKSAGVLPSQTIMIGDEIRDIAAAKNAGISAGVVTWGYNSGYALKQHQPDYLFDCFEAIPNQLLPDSGITSRPR